MTMTCRAKIESRSEDQTRELARLLGAIVDEPAIIGLDGMLGAGKTQFVRGFMQGVDPAYETWVSSPTYALCNVYPSTPRVQHVDAYRLTGFDDLESIGFWEFVGEGLTVVEWASRIPELLDECDLSVQLEGSPGGTRRTLDARAVSPRGELLLGAWVERLRNDGWDVH